MTVQELGWVPFVTLFNREVHRFLKVVVQTVVTPFVSSSLYLMIFGVSLGRQITIKGDVPYLSFLIPGLIMMGCLNNAFQNSSSSIVTSKFSGDLEDLRAAPFSVSQLIAAFSLAALIRGLIVGLITFAVGQASYFFTYGTAMPVYSYPVVLIFLVVGGLAFANLGISVAFWARSFDQMSAIGGFVLMPLIYLGGVFFSVDHLPEFWKKVSLFNPLLYMINGVRYGVLGASDVSFATSLGVSLAAFVGSIGLAAWSSAPRQFSKVVIRCSKIYPTD